MNQLSEELLGYLFLLSCFVLPSSVPWRIVFQNNDHDASPCLGLCIFEEHKIKQLVEEVAGKQTLRMRFWNVPTYWSAPSKDSVADVK